MSQHILNTTMSKKRKVTVMMGYDRPLDYVFCTVMNSDGDVIYSNLDDDRAGTDLQDVEYFRPVLQQLGIKVPEEMLRRALNVGCGHRRLPGVRPDRRQGAPHRRRGTRMCGRRHRA